MKLFDWLKSGSKDGRDMNDSISGLVDVHYNVEVDGLLKNDGKFGITIGDIFLYRDTLYFVAYELFSVPTGGLGGFEFLIAFRPIAGLPMALIDNAVRGQHYLERAMGEAGAKREEDFGLTVEERLSRRGGFKIELGSVVGAQEEKGWVLVTCKTNADSYNRTLRMRGHNKENPLAEVLDWWRKGLLSERSGDIEGLDVGISIDDLFGNPESVKISTDQFLRMALNEEYMKRLISEVFSSWFPKSARKRLKLLDPQLIAAIESRLASSAKLHRTIAVLTLGALPIAGYYLYTNVNSFMDPRLARDVDGASFIASVIWKLTGICCSAEDVGHLLMLAAMLVSMAGPAYLIVSLEWILRPYRFRRWLSK